MKRINSTSAFLMFFMILCSCNSTKSTDSVNQKNPNIIVIYADDLGYGDLSSYGATAIKTPNIDQIADEGIRFTNGYATSATCTPSRYALLTGQYPWRNERARILRGNAPLIIDTTIMTLPKMLRNAGYSTAVTGKWHLGLGGELMNWNEEIIPGPNDIGFDYSYILASTNDRVPSVYVENNLVPGLDPNDPLEVSYSENFAGEPTGKEHPELLKMHPSHGHDMSVHNGISRIGFQKGGKSAFWIDEHVADTILDKALDFISTNQQNPFFLFYSLHQPHVPRTPHPRFVGKSGMGPRGDVILEIDEAVGKLLDHLNLLGLNDNTMIIFSSDNGPVLDDGYHDDAVTKIGDHKPAGILRGGKYSTFDAGTRLPFMVRWPGKISPGTSDALVCQIDFMASLASLTDQNVPEGDGENVLPALLGQSKTGRESLVLEGSAKRTYYRRGDYVMIPPYEGPEVFKNVNIESGFSNEYQLFNLKLDPTQKTNLAGENSELLESMITEYEKIKSN